MLLTLIIYTSINYEVRDSHYYREGAKVYNFRVNLDIEGASTYSKKRAVEAYCLTVFCTEPRYDKFTPTLADCHIHEEAHREAGRFGRCEAPPGGKVP